MADSTWGGLAEGLLAGYTVVSKIQQRDEELRLQKKKQKMAEHQADMNDMNYFINMMNSNAVGDDMKSTAFDSLKTIFKKNGEYFGIPENYNFDKLQYQSGNKQMQDFLKRMGSIESQYNSFDKNGNRKMTMGDKYLAQQEALYNLDSKIREEGKSLIKEYGAIQTKETELKQQKELRIMGMAASAADKVKMVEGEGGKDLDITPGLGYQEKQDILQADRIELLKEKSKAAAESGDPSDREKFEAQQEKQLRDVIHRNYGFETDFPDEETGKKARQVMVDATKLLRSKSVVDPKTGERRRPSIAEAFKMADTGYKRSLARDKMQKMQKADPGRFMNNVDRTVKELKTAVTEGDLTPVESVKHLKSLGWNDEDLVNIATQGHGEIGAVTKTFETTLKKKNQASGWYGTGAMDGLQFYWDQKKGKVTNIRTSSR